MMSNRRKLIIALGMSALAAPLAVFAQQAKELPRVGYISQVNDSYFDLFQRHMRVLGYADGSNILFERRDSQGQLNRIPALVSELVQQQVRVLIAPNNVAIEASRKATATIPVVMVASIDPVVAGFVATLARPGGNITGVANLLRDLSAKRIEMLREIFPKLSRLAILWDADGPGPKIAFQNYETVAQASKVRVQSFAIRGQKPELEAAFQAAKTGGAEAMIVVLNPTMSTHRSTVMALSRKHRLPLIVENDGWVNDGGLLSYSASLSEISQRIAVYVDKILKGAKPADLPVEQPTKFELVINLRTAKSLSIKIPQSIMVRADSVIE